jgi:nitroreductase
MADLFSIIADRRSIKRFTSKPVELDKVLQAIQAGALAPSSGNLQNWSFIVITDLERIRAMYNHTLNQEPFLSAMAAVIICGDVEHAHTMYGMRGKRLYTIQNCAAAAQNMLLAAHAIGLGAIWIGAFDEERIASMFKIPDHQHRPQAILLFGYPDYTPEPKQLKPLDSIVYFNEFGNKVLRPHLVFFDWVKEWRLQGQKMKSHLQYAASQVKPKEKEERKADPRATAYEMRRKFKSAFDTFKKEEYK